MAGEAVEAGGNEIESLAKGFCPVLTGALQASIQTKVNRSGDSAEAIIAPGMPYDIYVEYGTGRRGRAAGGGGFDSTPHHLSHNGQAPQPYMHPAFEQGSANFSNILREVFSKIFG